MWPGEADINLRGPVRLRRRLMASEERCPALLHRGGGAVIRRESLIISQYCLTAVWWMCQHAAIKTSTSCYTVKDIINVEVHLHPLKLSEKIMVSINKQLNSRSVRIYLRSSYPHLIDFLFEYIRKVRSIDESNMHHVCNTVHWSDK